MRRFRKGGQLNLTLGTAYTKFWIGIGRLCEPFQLEMHSMTVRAFNIHGTQRMPEWRFMIWTTTFWNIPQGLIVNHDLLNMFCFHLLIHLLLLIKINLVLLSFLIIINLPFLVLLLLQFVQIGLILLFLYLPLVVLLLLHFSQMSLVFYLPQLFSLPLQFSQMSFMLQDFHLPLLLSLPLQFSQVCLML